MICRNAKCKKEISNAPFCQWCGTKQEKSKGVRKRGNGTGTTYKRGQTWTASTTVGWKVINKDGIDKKVPIKRTKGGFKTKREALEYIPILRNEQPRETVTLDKLYQGWSNSKMLKLSKSKQTAYKIAYGKLVDILYTDIKMLTIEDLQEAVNKKCTTYYPAKDVKTLLSHLYKRAVAQGDVLSNLAKFIELPELEETEQQPFNEDELKIFWEDYGKGNKFTGYILLMIYTGMMPGELFDCSKDMIDWERQQIIGCGKKTKKRKETPLLIPDIIVPIVADLCESSQSKKDKLLCMNRDKFYETYKITLERCGCRPLPPYSCRHTTATALALGDIAPSVIQKIMRHTKFATTQRYIHVDTAPMLDAMNKVLSKWNQSTDSIPTTSV